MVVTQFIFLARKYYLFCDYPRHFPKSCAYSGPIPNISLDHMTDVVYSIVCQSGEGWEVC